MSEFRRIDDIIDLNPPTFWTGVGQVVDVWGNAFGDIRPPRVERLKRVARAVKKAEDVDGVQAALSRDVRKIGGDIARGMERHAAGMVEKGR